jgi:hypothetical protein
MKKTSRKQSKSKSKSRTNTHSSNKVYRKKSETKKRITRTRTRKGKGKGKSGSKRKGQGKKQRGGECEYLKVQGMTLPDLKIPDQYAALSDNCQSGPTPGPGGSTGLHPNISNN